MSQNAGGTSEHPPTRQRRRMRNCPHCDEIFVNEDDFRQHMLTVHGKGAPPCAQASASAQITSTSQPLHPPFWPQELPKRLLLLLALALWSALVGWHVQDLYAGWRQSELQRQLKPASSLLERVLGPGRSRLQLLDDRQGLKLQVSVDCSAEESRQLNTILQNLLSIDPAQGDDLLTVRAPVARRDRKASFLLLAALLFSLLCLTSLRFPSRARPASPQPPLSLSCPRQRRPGMLRRIFGWWRPSKSTPLGPIVNGKQEAAIVLMSLPPAFSASIFKELGPTAVQEITSVIVHLPQIEPQLRQEVLKTFQGYLDVVCCRSCGRSSLLGECQPARVAATLVEFYLSAIVTGDVTQRPLSRSPRTAPAPKTAPATASRPRTWQRAHSWKLWLLALLVPALSLGADSLRPGAEWDRAKHLEHLVRSFIQADSLVVEVCQRRGRTATAAVWVGVSPEQAQDALPLVQRMMRLSNLDVAKLSYAAVSPQPSSRVLPPGYTDVWAALWVGLSASLLALAPCLPSLATRWKARWKARLKTAPPPAPAEPTKKLDITELMQVDPVSLEVGRGLLDLVDPRQGAKLLQRVTAIRVHLARELGIVLPGVGFRDNPKFNPLEYALQIRGCEVARGTVGKDKFLDAFLAIGPEEKLRCLGGPQIADPTYGMPGVWIEPEQRGDAERLGCMIFDPISVIACALTEVVRSHASELLGRQELSALLNTLEKTHPVLIQEVIPRLLSLGELQTILHNLLQEGVSIRDLVTILETLARHATMTTDTDLLTEFARAALCRSICHSYAIGDKDIYVMTLSEDLEASLSPNDLPELAPEILLNLGNAIGRMSERGFQPIVLTSPLARPLLRKLAWRCFPSLVFLSWNEIAPNYKVKAVEHVAL